MQGDHSSGSGFLYSGQGRFQPLALPDRWLTLMGETQDISELRKKFAEDYCQSRGWPTDANDLTWEQIMEIRQQEGWKNPVQA